MKHLSRREWLHVAGTTLIGVALAPVLSSCDRVPIRLTVYKDADCSCCDPWVDHLRADGFHVDVVTDPTYAAMQSRKDSLRVPVAVRSCHTAVLDGARAYLIEGHVPAEAIRQLLRDRPAIAGLAVPDMPNGPPGMEFAADEANPAPYTVLAFESNGVTRTFAQYPGLRRTTTTSR